MKKLEFLLQKEGDRAWLPLETPDVEILEGKYRVVARIQHPNTDIEIRVTHTSFDEPAPRTAHSPAARNASKPNPGLLLASSTRPPPTKSALPILPSTTRRSGKSKADRPAPTP